MTFEKYWKECTKDYYLLMDMETKEGVEKMYFAENESKAAWNAALEEAAKLVDSMSRSTYVGYIPNEIRKLKGSK